MCSVLTPYRNIEPLSSIAKSARLLTGPDLTDVGQLPSGVFAEMRWCFAVLPAKFGIREGTGRSGDLDIDRRGTMAVDHDEQCRLSGLRTRNLLLDRPSETERQRQPSCLLLLSLL